MVIYYISNALIPY